MERSDLPFVYRADPGEDEESDPAASEEDVDVVEGRPARRGRYGR